MHRGPPSRTVRGHADGAVRQQMGRNAFSVREAEALKILGDVMDIFAKWAERRLGSVVKSHTSN